VVAARRYEPTDGWRSDLPRRRRRARRVARHLGPRHPTGDHPSRRVGETNETDATWVAHRLVGLWTMRRAAVGRDKGPSLIPVPILVARCGRLEAEGVRHR